MGIPDPASERYLMTRARQHAAELIVSFSKENSTDQPVPLLCERAAAIFDSYGDGLLEALRSAVTPTDDVEKKWLREHYLPLLVEFATALRDTIADQATRHTAAQAIQCKVLEHERHLRLVLDRLVTPSVLPPSATEESLLPAKS